MHPSLVLLTALNGEVVSEVMSERTSQREKRKVLECQHYWAGRGEARASLKSWKVIQYICFVTFFDKL